MSQSWVYPVTIVVLLGLIAYANYKIWQLQNTQKSFSRLVVDQLKTTVDSIDDIQKKLSKSDDVLVIQPSVIKDSWAYAPQWISFLQNSSAHILRNTYLIYKSQVTQIDADIESIFADNINQEERISLALRWSQKEDPIQRNAVIYAIRHVSDTKPVETKPIEIKVPETKAVETKPVETKPVEMKVPEIKPVEIQSETKPIESKVPAMPLENTVPESKPIEPKEFAASSSALESEPKIDNASLETLQVPEEAVDTPEEAETKMNKRKNTKRRNGKISKESTEGSIAL